MRTSAATRMMCRTLMRPVGGVWAWAGQGRARQGSAARRDGPCFRAAGRQSGCLVACLMAGQPGCSCALLGAHEAPSTEEISGGVEDEAGWQRECTWG